MAQSFRFRQRFLVIGLMAALIGASSLSTALAEQILTSAEQPIQMKLTTSLDAKTTHPGDSFAGVLMDSYQMSGKSLPEGTVFKGRVQRAHKSRPFGRPGYVVLEIDEAQLPSGMVHHFEPGGTAPRSTRLMNPAAQSGKKLFKDNLPYTVLSTATSISLRYAAGMSGGLILPITLGSRMALGVAMQMRHPGQSATAQNQPAHSSSSSSSSLSSTVGQGVAQGSGLNSAYHFLTSAPEPVLTEGTVIPLHFRSHDLAGLFSAGETITASESQTQTQPRVEQQSENAAEDTVSSPSGKSSSSLAVPVTPQQTGQAIQTSVDASLIAQPTK